MKRVWLHVLAGLSLLACGGITFAACVHNDSSIFIQDVLATQEVANNQPCVFTTSTTQPVISSGILDVDFRFSYDAMFLVGNQLVAEANSQQLMTETSNVTLQGAIVRITDAAGTQIKTYTRLTAGTVYAAVSSVPGYAAISATIIDSDTIMTNPAIQNLVVNAPAGSASVRLISYIRFFGNTFGGRYVESDEFEFPVDVCRGCLITFSPNDICSAEPPPNCNKALSGGMSNAPIPCQLGQDLPVDCSQCQGVPDCNPHPRPADSDGGC